MKEKDMKSSSTKILSIALSVFAIFILNKPWLELIFYDDSTVFNNTVVLNAPKFFEHMSDLMISMNQVDDMLTKYVPLILVCLHCILTISFAAVIIFNLTFLFSKTERSEKSKESFDSCVRETVIVSIIYIVAFFLIIGVYESKINNYALSHGYSEPIIDITTTSAPFMFAAISVLFASTEKDRFAKYLPSAFVTRTATTAHFCTGCGTAIPSGSSFCPVCGKAVAPVTAPTSVSARPEVLARIEEEEKRRKEALRIETTLKSGGWKCTCGRVNPSYTGTCACGNTKYN